MPKFRKKREVIEARFLTDKSREDIMTWVAGEQECWITEDGDLKIHTRPNALHGYTMLGQLGHWIVYDPMEGFYPMPRDVFEELYELVS